MKLRQSRQWLLPALCILIAFTASSQTAQAGPDPIEVGPGVHLFVDDYLVEKMTQVWRSLNIGRKHAKNPLLKPDRPWEGYLVLQPGTVIWDEEDQIFKMWYNTIGTRERPDVEDFLCYATSKDGITWEKPDLGLIEFQGSKANNIFLKWSGWTHSVLKDKRDPDPSRRYKLLYWLTHEREQCGIWVAFSPDGKRWTNYAEKAIVPCWATGDTFEVTQHPETGQFILYHKTIGGPIRKVSRMVSDDFIHWRDSQEVLAPDKHDPPDTQFYGLSAFPYGNQFLGLLWVYHTYTHFMDIQLVSSRDSIEWERSADRKLFLHLATTNNFKKDAFDHGMVYPSSNPIVKDGKVWIYYSGFSNLHNAPSEDHDGQIGLATIRQDGWVSIDATSEGSIQTRRLKLKGSSLWVNMSSLTGSRPNFERDSGKEPYREFYTDNPSAKGYVRVEVQDRDGRVLPGYEAANCSPLMGTGIYQKVSWEGGRDLSAVAGREIRLRFVLGNARLYSFKLE